MEGNYFRVQRDFKELRLQFDQRLDEITSFKKQNSDYRSLMQDIENKLEASRNEVLDCQKRTKLANQKFSRSQIEVQEYKA